MHNGEDKVMVTKILTRLKDLSETFNNEIKKTLKRTKWR